MLPVIRIHLLEITRVCAITMPFTKSTILEQERRSDPSMQEPQRALVYFRWRCPNLLFLLSSLSNVYAYTPRSACAIAPLVSLPALNSRP